jgi:hypothetical protein
MTARNFPAARTADASVRNGSSRTLEDWGRLSEFASQKSQPEAHRHNSDQNTGYCIFLSGHLDQRITAQKWRKRNDRDHYTSNTEEQTLERQKPLPL